MKKIERDREWNHGHPYKNRKVDGFEFDQCIPPSLIHIGWIPIALYSDVFLERSSLCSLRLMQYVGVLWSHLSHSHLM